MIVFRQKEFLTPLTRVRTKFRRFFKPIQYIDPRNQLDFVASHQVPLNPRAAVLLNSPEYKKSLSKKVGDLDLEKHFKKDTIHLRRKLKGSSKKTWENIKDVGRAIGNGVSGIVKTSTSKQAPLNPAQALIQNTPDYKAAAAKRVDSAKADFVKVKDNVTNILSRTNSAAIGPVTPLPGATEALGVVGPFIDEFTPVGEIVKGIVGAGKKGVSTLSKRIVKKTSKN